MESKDYLFYRCVICGKKSSDSARVGGIAVTTQEPTIKDVWITACLCGKCEKRWDRDVDKKLCNQFMKLYNKE
jgi:hypothetical protein